jgi:hypothetical protein
MRINDLLLESTHPLFESVLPSYHPTVRMGEDLARSLMEAQLTAQQVQALFAQVQQQVDAGGGNRTIAGKGVDVAKKIKAIYDYAKKVTLDTGLVKGFESGYDKVAAELKEKTGGDAGVMRYIQKYRDFAKKHPGVQKAVYATLVLAVGVAGYVGMGPAFLVLKPAIIGVMKFTDKLLQGEGFVSSAVSGLETYSIASIAQSIGAGVKTLFGGGIPTEIPKPIGGGAGAVAATDAGPGAGGAATEPTARTSKLVNRPDDFGPTRGSSGDSMIDQQQNPMRVRNRIANAYAEKMGLPPGNHHGAKFLGGVPVEIDGKPVPQNLYTKNDLENIQAAKQGAAQMDQSAAAGKALSNPQSTGKLSTGETPAQQSARYAKNDVGNTPGQQATKDALRAGNADAIEKGERANISRKIAQDQAQATTAEPELKGKALAGNAADAVTGSSPTSKGVNVIKKMIAAGEIKTPEDFKAALKTAAQQAGYNSMQAQSGISNIQSALQAELRDAGYGSKVRIIDQDFVDALAKKATGGAAAAAQPTGAATAAGQSPASKAGFEPTGDDDIDHIGQSKVNGKWVNNNDPSIAKQGAKLQGAMDAAGPAKAPVSASISNTTGTDMLDAAQQDPKVKKVLDYLTKDINDKFAKVGSGKLGSEVLQNIQKDLMKQVDTLYPAEAELQMTAGQKKQLVYQLVAKAQDSYIESSPKLSGIVNDTTSKLFDKIGSGAIKTELDLDKFIRSEIIGQNPDLKSTPAITTMLTAKADSLLKNIYSDAMEADPKLTKNPEWKIKAVQQYLSKKESINFYKPALTESQVMEAFRGTAFAPTLLTETQVKRLFQNLEEGPIWDKIKSAGGAVAGAAIKGANAAAGSKLGQAAIKGANVAGQKIATGAENLTNKVTADKLMGAWKKAGSPTDSTAVFEFLKTQGIDENVLRTAFKAANIPVGKAKKPAATPGAATAGGAAGKPGTAGTTPSGVPAISAQYNAVLAQIQKLQPADKQKLVALLQQELATA